MLCLPSTGLRGPAWDAELIIVGLTRCTCSDLFLLVAPKGGTQWEAEVQDVYLGNPMKGKRRGRIGKKKKSNRDAPHPAWKDAHPGVIPNPHCFG